MSLYYNIYKVESWEDYIKMIDTEKMKDSDYLLLKKNCMDYLINSGYNAISFNLPLEIYPYKVEFTVSIAKHKGDK